MRREPLRLLRGAPAIHLLVTAVAVLAGLGCDPEPTEDAGIDATVDASRDANLPDAPPPMCTPGCDTAESCCEGFVVPDTCHNLRTDVEHCGSCNIDCVTTDRGDACMNSACVCGAEDLGCLGTSASFCCPPLAIGGARYCANLNTNPTDCGDCGAACNLRRADRCDGGRCQCGDMRTQCSGEDNSICCADGADIGCVDSLTDRLHCGGCNTFCIGSERCENGSCVRGENACTDRCGTGEVCCNGACCTRRRCVDGMCTGTVDPDAGTPDGGLEDGGLDDAGADAGPDASIDDAGIDAGLDGGV